MTKDSMIYSSRSHIRSTKKSWCNGIFFGWLQKVWGLLCMHEIQLCEKALQKYQHIETDDDRPSISTSTDKRLEEKLQMLQRSLNNMIVQRSGLWCSTHLNDGHIKYYYKYNNAPERDPNFRWVQIEIYCEIYQSLTNHSPETALTI